MQQTRRETVCPGNNLLALEHTITREFGVYDFIRDNFPKYVVSLDEFDLSRNGIVLPKVNLDFFRKAYKVV